MPYDAVISSARMHHGRLVVGRPLTALWIVAGAAAVSALALPPAAAAASGTRTGTIAVISEATGLRVSLRDLALAGGVSSTSALDDGGLEALGAGVLEPSPSGEASAVTEPGGPRVARRTCGGALPAFPAPFNRLLSASATCASAAVASASASTGTARATGDVARLELDLAPLLDQVVKGSGPVESALESLFGKLPPLPAGGETVAGLLGQLAALPTSALGLEAEVGPSTSATIVSASGWSTTAEASGGVVTLLPGAGRGGAPLARIVVGDARASASVGGPSSTGSIGSPAATDRPALVTVEVDAPAIGPRTFSVVPGQSLTILAGTPLESTIAVTPGSVTTSPRGAVAADAGAVSIFLAEGVGASGAAGNGGVHLELAAARATAYPAVLPELSPPAHEAAPPPTLSAVPNATVPHTGLPWAGGAPLLAGGALTGAGLLAWPRLRRLTGSRSRRQR
ncbi:MAG TPA: hypothetical protein VKU92_13640 [Acidimicrobiales bacterium]|nr:hypothetical protein [Acidimicrobiales bacterium]